jgi:DNA polymerase III epsilon subunit-like protein
MSIGSNLLRFQKNQEFSADDLETEGLNGIYSRPWQWGHVEFTIDRNIKDFSRYIWWPNLNVSKDAARITRFNYQDYKDKAEDPEKLLEEFEDIFYSKSKKVVNQNLIGFDGLILNNWRRALGKKPYWGWLYEPYKVYDTLALSRAFKKGLVPDTSSPEAFLIFQFKMLSIRERLKCSLGAIGKELKIEFNEDGLHNAADDTLLVREVFRKQIYHFELI